MSKTEISDKKIEFYLNLQAANTRRNVQNKNLTKFNDLKKLHNFIIISFLFFRLGNVNRNNGRTYLDDAVIINKAILFFSFSSDQI